MHGIRLLLVCGLLIGLAGCQASTKSGSTATPTGATSYIDANGMLPQAPSGQPHAISGVTGDYRHAGSGLVFPETSNGFRRLDLMAYNADDTDVSASYEYGTSRIRMTLFVFPIWAWSEDRLNIAQLPEICAGMWDNMKRSAEYVLLDSAKLEDRLESNPRFPDANLSGIAIWNASGTKTGTNRPLRSEMYASCGVHKLWIVQHRITYVQGIDAEATVREFRAAVPLAPAP